MCVHCGSHFNNCYTALSSIYLQNGGRVALGCITCTCCSSVLLAERLCAAFSQFDTCWKQKKPACRFNRHEMIFFINTRAIFSSCQFYCAVARADELHLPATPSPSLYMSSSSASTPSSLLSPNNNNSNNSEHYFFGAQNALWHFDFADAPPLPLPVPMHQQPQQPIYVDVAEHSPSESAAETLQMQYDRERRFVDDSSRFARYDGEGVSMMKSFRV